MLGYQGGTHHATILGVLIKMKFMTIVACLLFVLVPRGMIIFGHKIRAA